MSSPVLVRTLIGLHFFVAIGAIVGGGTLIYSPDGRVLRIPMEILEHSPFENFLVPGLFLFTFIGLFSMLTAYGLSSKHALPLAEKINLHKRRHWPWAFSLYAATILATWIVIQAMIVRGVHWLHIVYFAISLAIFGLTLSRTCKLHYRRNELL